MFPVVFDAFSPLSIKSPSFALLGVIIYFRVPSSYLIKDILADLLGSYSIDSMIALPDFDLWKSRILYLLLWPPPLCLTVILPLLFLPPFFVRGANKGL